MSAQYLRPVVVWFLMVSGVSGLPETRAMAAREQPAAGESPDSVQCQQRLSAYVRLHREAADQLVLAGVDPDVNGGAVFREALANAIRSRRRHARAGDTFCPGTAPRIVQFVRANMAARSFEDRQAILSSVPRVLQVRVNDAYPTNAPLATVPPLLLLHFQPLPPELQYRFLERALILLDVDANLIVDFIPAVLPRY